MNPTAPKPALLPRRLALPVAALLFAGLLAPSLPLRAESEARTWTSKDGQSSVEGTFVSKTESAITIRLSNGQNRDLPVSMVSEADIAYVESAEQSAADQKMASLGSMGELLHGKLVDVSGAAVNLLSDREAPPKYYIFYYSASWCPPCRDYTPELVRYYDRMRRSGGEVEVVLVPSDRSEKEALAYLKDYRMKFPMIDFSSRSSSGAPHNPGRGIPALRMVDANGETVLTSAEVPRSDFLKEADRIAKK